MDEVLTQIQILIDCIAKKIGALNEILALSNEQTTSIMNNPGDNVSFNELVERKKVYINRVDDLDKIFVDIYDRIRDYMGKGNADHRRPMLDLQAHIAIVADLTLKIKTIEEKNARILTGGVRKPPKKIVSSDRAVTAYKKNKKS